MSKKIALVGSRVAAKDREVAFALRSQLLRLGRQSLAVTLSGLLFLQPAIANAQSVSAAGSAPVANQAGVGAAPNGVPLIDIVTPNAAGLSHNKYDNFNVGTQGLILNNFKGEQGTSNLGGVTPGNPNLNASNPASVILNEVTSGNRSALNGPTEVYGGRADVIIANPNGITCAGCGFINTPRATLTTGVPNIGSDGSLTGFTVNGGDVTFEGTGGNFAAAPGAVDLFDVVSRQIHVNAPIYGKSVRLTGGASQYNYATGEATALTATSGTPEYAIDGSALGAMQADRIKVVVTEKGAGVKMSGDMAANAGELSLSADGKISIGNASARDGVTITSKQKVTAAKVTSRQKVAVRADQGITLLSVAADSDIVFASGTGLLSVSGDVNSGTTVQMSSGGGIAAGTVTAGNGAVTLVASSGDIAIAGTASSTSDLTLTATAGSISAASLLSYNNLALTAGNSLTVSGNVLAQGNVSATAQSISTGMVVSGINIAGTSAAPDGNVVLGSAGNLSLTATGGTIATGNLQSAGSLNTSATGNITAGNIQSAGNLTVTATSLAAANVTSHGGLTVNAAMNASGQILGAGDVLISGAGIQATAIASGVDFALTNAAGGNIVLGSAGALDLKAAAGTITVGTLLSAGNLTAQASLLQSNNLTSHGNVGIDGGMRLTNQLLGASDITINGNANGVSAGLLASGVNFAATKAAGGNIVLAGSGDLTINDSAGAIQAGTVMAAGAINVTGQTITADAITGGKNITLTGATSPTAGSGSVKISGQVLGGGNVGITGSSIAADAIVSGVDIAATNAAGGRITLGPTITGAGNLSLTSAGAISAGTLLSAGDLIANGASITSGNISVHHDMTLGGVISVSGQILGAGNVSITGLGLSAQTLVAGIDFNATNAAGGNIVLGQTGDLTVNVNGAVAASTIQAAGAIDISGTSVAAASITGHKDISLSGTAAGGVNVANQVLGGGNVGISGPSIKAGTIVSGIDFAATAAANGNIVQTTSGDLTLAAAGSIDTGTLLSAGKLNATGSTITAGTVTAHGDMTLRGATSVTGQILSAGNVLITGQSLAAQTVIAGIDFGATNAAGGNIVVGQLGDLTVQLSGGFSASTMQAAGAINVNAATMTADTIIGHHDITLSGATTVNQQILGGGNIGISGSSVKAGAIVSGVDFAATAAANGNIVQTTSGNLTLASTGAINTGTLLSAGNFSASGTAVTADAVTAHGDITLNGATSVTGQVLGAGNILITGQSLSAQSVVAGIDFGATNAAGGNIVVGQFGDLKAQLSSGFSASTMQAAGTINVNAATVTADTVTGHKDVALAGATTVHGQVLSGGNIIISGPSIAAGAIVSGVDFTGTTAANGNIVQTSSGDMTLASSGNLTIGTLSSAGNLTAQASDLSANSITSHGTTDLAANGLVNVSGQVLSAVNLSIDGASLNAGLLVSGVDFTATAANGGNIVLGGAGKTDLTVSGNAAAGTILSSGDITAKTANLQAGSVTSHGNVGIIGNVDVSNQILAAGELAINGGSISAPTLISGIDFAATNAAGGNIVLASSGAMNLTASGNITAGTILSAGDVTAKAADLIADSITAHGNADIVGSVDISNQIIAAGNLTVSGGHINAPTLISGIDFAATNARGGGIVLGTAGDMNLTASAGITAQTMLSAGAVNASGSAITANAVTGHGDITLAASNNVNVSGQLLGAGDVLLSGSTVQLGQAVTGVDFAATARSSNGAIALGQSGDLTINAGSASAGTLIVAGNLNVAASAFTGGNITGHGAVAIGSSTSPGAVRINGQLLGASNVSVTGSGVSGNVIAAGVDFAAMDQSGAGNVILGPGGNLTLASTAGDISFNSLLAAGTIAANAANNISANAVAHGDLSLTAGNAITLNGQSLASRNANLSARSMTIDTLVSGVDFAATNAAAGGSLMLQRTGVMTLSASSGSISANSLLSGGNLAATATQNIGYNSLQSLGDAALTGPGAIAYTSTTRVGGNLTLNTGALDLSGSRGSRIAAGGTLIVNASSANLSGSNLVFGGLTLNLSGSADLSNAQVSTVTNAGGSGDITISAAGLATTAGTSLLAAHDLTLNLPSLGNIGQLAAGNNLTFNVAGDFYNSPSGLVFAGNNANLFVGGTLTNDQGAILADGGLTIRGTTEGQRNAAVTNVSGLIQSGGDMSILTSNLTNRRSTTPTWVTGQLVSSGGVVGTFVLNPAVAGQPFAYLESTDQNMFQLYAGVDPGQFSDYQPLLYSVATLADGTSYHAWTWVSGSGPTEVRPIFDWIKARVPKDANGNPILDPNNPSRYFIVDEVVRSGSDTSTTYTWDPTSNISQSVYEDRFTSALSPEAVIRAGGNLTVDATNLTNSYSRIEAGGDATLKGSTLTNEGVVLNRTTTLTCNAQSACTAYNSDGSADPSRSIANGTSIMSGSQVIGGAAGTLKAARALSLNFGTVNNTSLGSTGGSAAVSAPSTSSDPLSALNGMTAGGALFNVNAALGSFTSNGGANVGSGPSLTGTGTTIAGGPTVNGGNLTAVVGASVGSNGVTLVSGPSISSGTLTASGAAINPNSLMGKLTAALGNSGNLAQVLEVNGAKLASLAKPQSGGVGGTVPGQVFLFETRAAFLDVSKFYGSSYFIDRVGYTPETKVPFLGDAYFDNQLVDEQMRQLVGDGLGAGSFIPGNNATDQMKTLLDNGVAYAEANGLALGQALTPEQAASLTQSMVIYQTQIVDGAQVLVPVVYLSAADKAKVNAGGAVIAGNSVSIDAGSVNNSGAIAAADGMTINATEIKANGGTFLAGGNMNLNATNGITLAAQTMTIGGQNVVNTNAGVSAGGNLQIAAGGTLSLEGTKIAAGGAAQLSGANVNLTTVKVDNGGQQNATGARVNAGGNLTIAANNDINVIGSSAKAAGDLKLKATNGAVNIVSTDLARKTNDGYTKTTGTDQQASQLTAGGNLQVNANTGVLISGSDLTAKGDVGLTSNGDINVTTSQNQSNSTFGKNSSSELTHNGSTITAGGDLVAKSNSDINVIGSTMDADGKLGLQAAKNVTIAEATDSATLDVKSSSKKSGFFGSTKENASGHLETTTAAGSSLSGKDGVTIISGGDTTVSASKVTAGDDTHTADLKVQTDGNLIVTAGKDTETEHDSAKRKGFLRSGSSSYDGYNETTVGSQLSASGDVNLDAGKAAAIVGSKVNADGSLNISGESVSIIGAQENHESDSKRKDSGLFVGSGGGFISLYGKNEKQGQQSSTDNVGSELTAGKDVNLTARATDLNIMGSSVNADRDINLSAARDVNVTPGAESSSQSEQQKKSGFGLALSAGNGGFSIGIGAQSTKDSKAQQSDTNAVSTLAAGRDLNISAGNNVNLQATSASAERDVNLFAKNDINLLSANDVTNYQEVHEKTFAGVTISVTSQVGKAAESIMNSAERLSDSGGVNAVTNTAIAGLGFYQAYEDLKAASENFDAGKGLSFSIGINAGVNHQESSWSSSSSTPVVTDIRAGRSITMEAEMGSITSDGAQILAGYDKYGIPTIPGDPRTGDIFLSAGNGDINLNAATGTSDSTSSNNSWSAGVGVNFGCSTKGGCQETGVGVNASYGKGGSETSGTNHTNTHVNGTGDVTIVTNDLGLKGATVAGNSVSIDVKNLTIESQLDTQKAKADQFNVSGQIGFGNTGVSGTVQNAKGDAVLVSEQSGIHAGTGGLNIDVSGQTSLVGGLITSQATADKNSFSTGTLTVADIDTHSTWKAETYGGGIGTGGLSIAPPVKAGENETGKAYSAIGGNIGIMITDPAHQVQDIGTIRRDTENTNTSLPGLPDLQNILRQQYKTQADLQAAQRTMATLVGEIASELRDHASTPEEYTLWDEGGAGRAVLHAIGGGLLGGVNGWEGALKGALGGAATTLLAPAIERLINGMVRDSNLSAADREQLAALLGESLSAVVGGAVGGGEGAAYGAANYQYNYLNDKQRKNGIAAYRAAKECKATDNCTVENARLAFYLAMSQANTATLISVCTSDPSSSACRSMISDLQSFVNAYNNLNIPTAVDIVNGTDDDSTAATQALAGMDGFIPYDVILAQHLAEVANGKSADVAIQEALLDISQRNGGIKTFLDAMGVAYGIGSCAGSFGITCAIGALNAAVSANHLVSAVPQALTGRKAQTAAVLALTGMGVDKQEAEKWQNYVETGVLVVSVAYVGGEMIYQLRVNKAALAAGDEGLAALNNKSFNPKTNETVDNVFGAACSFDGATLVKTIDGFTAISQIRPGKTLVWSRDEKGREGYKLALAKIQEEHARTLYLTVKSDTNGRQQTITTTMNHPFFAVLLKKRTIPTALPEGYRYKGPIKNGAWIAAGDLLSGEKLLDADGSWNSVVNVRIEDKSFDAYNLTIADFHTYFVKQATNEDVQAVWVHNNCFDDLANLYNKNHPLKSLDIEGVQVNVGSGGNTSGTTIVLDSQTLTDAQILTYAEKLAGGALTPHPSVSGIFTATSSDGTRITLRSISSSAGSTGARWTIDIAGSDKIQGVNPKLPRVELKFR
ncbi:filamentous hemagglutinin [Rhizobium sp. BK312]|uniref:hemagglutinin repeat-containing protein n=1 Tax=Rhizobium sp. BK312 TaxID=2587080 RepID=UPI000DD50112|nr:hemagglutinin repeat-containing protein [Rhizobium sp. BK312]MBB3428189.1 filamentous hemagglutinin [Rhizobium sp. BK312]